MYTERFGLERRPFALGEDPAALYPSPQHREVLAGLCYGMSARSGINLLTGPAGCGKSVSFRRALLSEIGKDVSPFIIRDPLLNGGELLDALLLEAGVVEDIASKARKIRELQRRLSQVGASGKQPILVIEDAHGASVNSLQQIQTLADCGFDGCVVLIGQSPVERTLELEELCGIKQRITLWLRLNTLSSMETRAYVGYRWRAVGGSDAPFSEPALDAIFQASKGVPRVINTLCENSLLTALGLGETEVALSHVAAAAIDMNLPVVSESLEGEVNVRSGRAGRAHLGGL
jgi:type II secretory pathway predicted ATPase ExeA